MRTIKQKMVTPIMMQIQIALWFPLVPLVRVGIVSVVRLLVEASVVVFHMAISLNVLQVPLLCVSKQ